MVTKFRDYYRRFNLLFGLCFIINAQLVTGCRPQQPDLSYQQHKYYPIFIKYCGICHDISKSLDLRLEEKDWRKIVSQMRKIDVDLIPADETEKIIEFLRENRSPR